MTCLISYPRVTAGSHLQTRKRNENTFTCVCVKSKSRKKHTQKTPSSDLKSGLTLKCFFAVNLDISLFEKNTQMFDYCKPSCVSDHI